MSTYLKNKDTSTDTLIDNARLLATIFDRYTPKSTTVEIANAAQPWFIAIHGIKNFGTHKCDSSTTLIYKSSSRELNNDRKWLSEEGFFAEGVLTPVKSSSSVQAEEHAVKMTLEQVYRLEEIDEGRLAARKMMIAVERSYRLKNYTFTNRLIIEANLKKLNAHAVLGLVRSTAIMKDNLASWENLYRAAHKKLREQHHNPERLFIGLPKVTLQETINT